MRWKRPIAAVTNRSAAPGAARAKVLSTCIKRPEDDRPGYFVTAALTRVDRGERLVMCRELEEPFTDRAMPVETGVHRHDGPAARQIADRAVAEPTAPRAHVDVLGDGELAARRGNELPITVDVGRDRA